MTSQELDIPSEPSQLALVRNFVTSFCRADPAPILDDLSIHQLELAVNEATTNIMRHAHRGRVDLPIHIEVEADADQVVIQFHYGGATFDPTTVPLPAFDGSREGGFGVYFITMCVDQARYSCDDHGRNCLRLVKNRAQFQRESALPEQI
jgi:anti-sigma regulatory factor (Ser/Thr protein kinase)